MRWFDRSSPDRSRCPQCRERVSPFAAGCSICGADLDIRRFDRPQRWRPSQNPWIARVAISAIVVGLVALMVARSGDGRTSGSRAAMQTPPHSKTPKDAKAFIGSVPAGAQWPRSPDGYALSFVALIDLATLPHLDPLPRAGRLGLYWNGNPDDEHSADPVAAARVFYFAPGTPTESLEAPTETYPSGATYLRGKIMSFSGDPQQVVDAVTDPPAKKALIDAMNDISTPEVRPTHLLGAPFEIQGPILKELVYYLSTDTRYVSADSLARYSEAERHDPRQWVLLAQVEEQPDMILGDGGALYYLIPRIDLERQRFDRIAVIMQSH